MMYISEIQSTGRSGNIRAERRNISRYGSLSERNKQSRQPFGYAALRYGAAVLFFLVLFTGFMMMTSGASEQSPSPAADRESVVIVSAGDTLWGIAAELKEDGMDTRRAVYAIKKRNGLTNSTLQSGQKLIVPAW